MLPVLSQVFWYTVEFGVVQEADGVKAFGAAILSSYGELEHLAKVGLKLPQQNPSHNERSRHGNVLGCLLQLLLWRGFPAAPAIGEGQNQAFMAMVTRLPACGL